MVINRWQSVFLLIACIFMALGCFLPVGYSAVPVNDSPTAINSIAVHALHVLPLFIVSVLTAILLFIDIFLYNNFRLQKNVNLIAIFFTVAAAVIATIVGCWLQYIYSGAALIFAIWARTRITRDEKLLKSYDRLR